MKSKYIVIFFMFSFYQLSFSQNDGYTQKKELGLQGLVKSVTTYLFEIKNNTIPSDTVGFYGKNKMFFDKKGDAQTYIRIFNLPNYDYVSKSIFKGSGKNIKQDETYWLNDNPAVVLKYEYVWLNDLEYKIVAKNDSEHATRIIKLNPDFTMSNVLYTEEAYLSEEKIAYEYNEGVLTKMIVNISTTDNDKTESSKEIRVVKAVDFKNNPTTFYFYKSEDSHIPKSVVIKYYEYF